MDASRADALDGVVAVITGEALAAHNPAWMPTCPATRGGPRDGQGARFQGQEVAAVVAEDPYIAQDALELIDVH